MMISSIHASNGVATATADFVAGFVYGMTGDNQLTEIEACFQGGELMYQEIDTGIEDIKKGGWNNDTQAALQFGLAILQIPQALNTCENMDQDIAAIESWAQIFTNPEQLAATVSKHALFHKAELKADISTLEGDWDIKKFFQAGQDLATVGEVGLLSGGSAGWFCLMTLSGHSLWQVLFTTLLSRNIHFVRLVSYILNSQVWRENIWNKRLGQS